MPHTDELPVVYHLTLSERQVAQLSASIGLSIKLGQMLRGDGGPQLAYALSMLLGHDGVSFVLLIAGYASQSERLHHTHKQQKEALDNGFADLAELGLKVTDLIKDLPRHGGTRR